MAYDNQHLTIEQVSALLDQQLSAADTRRYQDHLHTCQQCQQQLEDLRTTAALLHALPRPALPRSFVLPLTTSIEQTAPVEELIASPSIKKQHITPLKRKGGIPPYVYTPMRVLSSIAAVIGIFLLLSALLPALLSQSGTTAISNSSGNSNAASSASSPEQDHTSALVTTSPSMTPHIVQPTAQQPAHAQGSGKSSSTGTYSQDDNDKGLTSTNFLLFDLTTTQGRAGLGFIFLLLGVMGLIAFRKRALWLRDSKDRE